jgi:hypothetical protein
MAKSKITKPKTTETVFDIKKPSTVTPAANSKNIILKSSPPMKDPMMTDLNNNGEDNEQIQGAPPLEPMMVKKINIQPLDSSISSGDLKPPESSQEQVQSEPEDSSSDGQAEHEPTLDSGINNDLQTDSSSDQIPSLEAKTEEEDQKESSTSEETPQATSMQETNQVSNLEQSNVSPDDNQSVATAKGSDRTEPKNAQKILEEQQAKRKAEIKNLIESKQFNLPINSKSRKKIKLFVIAGIILALILIVIWLDIALDAGIISIPGIHPFTHFFSN